MFLTFFFEPFLVGKVMKENHIRKVRKSEERKVKNIRKQLFHVSFTFLVLLFWTFLVRFSGPPTPSCQKEQENHKIGPQMSRIGTRKVKETQKIVF